ncbi:UDP-glucose/GDP-mannose dehydrogenase family protein [Candidatus Woesearchaeota archaeon]|nr:UDP-glucose/GDP-mannose dehydrogenase family protein [Candidatus Woesearchaeota archaeon]
MANIGIIGYGIVGTAVDYGFRQSLPEGKQNKILWYDKYKDGSSLEEVVENSDFIFVTLPTPYKNNRIDLTIMDENIDKIAKLSEEKDKVIVIKSSVIPGTTRNYAGKYPKNMFSFTPEFLTEANYLDDFVNPDRIVIGSDNDKIRLKVTYLHKERFPNVPYFLTDLTTAEMVKYMANCFLATKVIFGNEIYDLCEKMGIKYEEVVKAVVADKRIGPTHLDFTSLRGFGGKCLAKDIVALIGLFEEMGIDASLLKTVNEKNLRIRKVRDWEEIPFVKT